MILNSWLQEIYFVPQKASFDARISSKSNYISKNTFTKNYDIHSILFICTRVFKFDNSFFYQSVELM